MAEEGMEMTDEATVERVARAIYEAGIPKGGKYYHTWDDLESEGFYAQHDLAMKQAKAAIAALQPQGDGWQDIASAPRDGKTIVLWSKYHDEPVTAAWANGRWVARWDDCSVIESQGDTWTDYKLADVPTHWRPLPAPPAAEIERAPKQDGLAELRVGDFVMRTSPNGIWIGRTDGEAGEFATEHVERVIAQFYREQF